MLFATASLNEGNFHHVQEVMDMHARYQYERKDGNAHTLHRQHVPPPHVVVLFDIRCARFVSADCPGCRLTG